jgi:hypothetical protein
MKQPFPLTNIPHNETHKCPIEEYYGQKPTTYVYIPIYNATFSKVEKHLRVPRNGIVHKQFIERFGNFIPPLNIVDQ